MAEQPLDQSDYDAAAAVTDLIAERIAELDLAAEFEAAGSPYSQLDENGEVVTHHPPARSS